MCQCIGISVTIEFETTSFDLAYVGTYDGQNYWEFTYAGDTYSVYWSSALGQWLISGVLGSTDPSMIWATLEAGDAPCPINEYGVWNVNPIHPYGNAEFYSTEIECPALCGREDRMQWEFKSISIPQDFVEDDRGLQGCCCEQLVLASAGESWESDLSSGWIKMSDDPLDTFTFKLTKHGSPANYIPVPVAFPNEPNAYYSTIDWYQVLLQDGVGCYNFVIEFNISGITGLVNVGNFKLKQYTIQNALGTARIRAVFNGVQQSDGIDFTGADIVSDLRFYGYIGNRQPNMAIDNIIYGNREMKRVIRENLYSYSIETDPLDECIIKPITELYLLSENELYISDYNAHNHSYRYNDLPVIVNKSPEIEYYEFSRKAQLSCEVTDKFKDKRTFY